MKLNWSKMMITKKTSKKPSKKRRSPDWADEGNYKTIRPEAYRSIIEWLALPDDIARSSRLDLLTTGLPWASITHAVVHPSKQDLIAVKVDHENWNSPRFFNHAAFALMRLLTAFGGRVRMNNRQATDPSKKAGPMHFHPAINLRKPTNFALARIIWGARTNSEVGQVLPDAYDWGLENLKPDVGQERAGRTRGDAVMAALNYRYEMENKLKNLPIADDYLAAIMKCFVLLDELKDKIILGRHGSMD